MKLDHKDICDAITLLLAERGLKPKIDTIQIWRSDQNNNGLSELELEEIPVVLKNGPYR